MKRIDSKKKSDKDDLVDTDTDQETNEEESEGKHQRKDIKKDNLESYIDQKLVKDIREKIKLFLRTKTPKRGDDYDLVDTDTDQEINNK